ncbi:MAG: thymidine phosphorylase [Bacteroidetes bacterium]|nr:thymidine phosphorylase [Bacteroidota bacterium]MCW5893966.1 thymidine phosphorylase [Bacteroidota bacterium]
MTPVELIRKKRNGGSLSKDELHSFITGFVSGTIPEYQMSAFFMAVYFNGMSVEERATFTEVMLHSGIVVDLSMIPGVKVDKHSTGGVGDKVSLVLAPMVAACGVPVPMISGRGLGHTGGTLDKLESIPGFRTDLSIDEYKNVIAETGLVLIGQTKEIAPADKKMYALRDVTATVESIPLIAGSIMSKKLAEGIDALVLDVKTGNGAFMQRYDDSVKLAEALVSIGNSMGKKTIGFITDMNQPLGCNIGNWVEVLESVECLKGKNVPDLMEVTFVLGGAMLWLGKKADSIDEGIEKCKSAISSGKAYDKFLELVQRQGGDVSYLETPESYPRAAHGREVRSKRGGYITGFATMDIGLLAIELGAGRTKLDDVIDPKAGIVLTKKAGDKVEEGDLLATFWTDKSNVLDVAAVRLSAMIEIGDRPVTPPPTVASYIDEGGVKRWPF